MSKIIDPTTYKGALRKDIYLLDIPVVMQITGKKQSTVYEWADDRRPDVAPNFRDLCLIVDAIAKFHKKKAASFKFLQEMISAVLAVTADEIDEAKTAAALTRCAGDISYSILEAKTPAERFGVYGKLNEAEDYLTSLKLKHINQQAGNA